MALTQVTGPYPIFTDLDGTPLDDGYLYIGAINQDPEQNPIQVFWDANLTIQATQPIRTSNGYAYRNGTPALLYTAGEFSITIRNKREEFVLYSPVGYGFDPAAVSASVVQNDFIGNGVEVDFTLSASPSTKLATSVFINGVYQEKDSYSILGNVLTFTVAPPLSSGIEVMTNETGVINSGNATAISYTLTATGAVQQTVQEKLEQYISVKDFGAVGDGVADDTAAIQAALDSGYAVTFPQNFHGKITSGLTADEAIYMEDGAYIQPTGSGYTAIAISPQARSGPWRVVVGDGSTAFAGKGIVFGDPLAQGHTQITVDLLDARKCTSGGGVEINNLWESIVQKVSAYDCGDVSGYAVSINSNVGDSSNTTVFNNITIGQSNTNALYVSAQFCTFPMIYVEQVSTAASKFVWFDSCVKSNFGRVRIYNAGSANAWIGTAQSTFDFIDCESNLVFDWDDALGSEAVTIKFLACEGTISETSPVGGPVQSRPITILGCDLATLNTGANNAENAGGRWYVSNGNITTLQVGRNDYATNPRSELAADAVVFKNIDIGNFDIRDPEDSSVTFDNCRIRATGTTFNGYTKLLNSYVDANATFTGDNISALNYQAKIYADGTYFGGTFNTVGNVVGQVINSTIVGNMTATNGGTTAIGIVFSNTGCNGTVAAAFGNPPALAEIDGGVNWGRGKRIDNIASAVGAPKGWICTVSGNPGTWVSEGNL